MFDDLMKFRGRMSGLGFFPLLMVVAFGVFGEGLQAGGSRLAVMGSPELENETALLTGALSSQYGLEVVEREEISKLMAERNLPLSVSGERKALGALLKADGIVWLQREGEAVLVRLAVVDTGAIVSVFSAPFPVRDIAAWVGLSAGRIAKAAGTLAISTDKRIQISVLRLNAAQGGAQGAGLEQSVNRLFLERLSANGNLILLERSQLQDAAMEKAFDADSAAFWASSWVVEGSVTPTTLGYLLQLRLQAPDSGASHMIRMDAPDIPGLVEKANAEILAVLERPVRAWDSAAESARFAEEARWAAANGLWDQAAGAIECAVALGDGGADILEWRWKCYAQLARSVSEKIRPGGSRPAAWQVLAMSRSLLLCREALNAPPAGAGARFMVFPQAVNASSRFGTGKVADASELLALSGQMLSVFAGKGPNPDGAQSAALAELREQTGQLFEAIVAMSPALQLKPRQASVIPPWTSEGDPQTRRWADMGGPYGREKREFANVHMERLAAGRFWEESPGPYYAYVRQCLGSDLPADPHFFRLVLHLIGEMAQRAAFIPSNPQGAEWRDAGREMATGNASVQVGAATLLCRTGLAREGIEIFEKRREAILKGELPLEYLLSAFVTSEMIKSTMEHLGQDTLAEAAGEMVSFVTGLLQEGWVPSRTALESLAKYWLSQRQAAALLASLRTPRGPHPDSWGDFAGFALRSLAERAGEPPEPAPAGVAPAVPAATPGPRNAIKVDLAWVAKNPADPAKPGVIRWAIPQDNKIWLQVEFGSKESIKRQFVVVDLPSLKSRVRFRDVVPDIRRRTFPGGGPTFAVEGDALFFRGGEGISAVRAGDVQKLTGPDLVEPFLWMVEGRLYAADRVGVFVCYDLGSGTHEILASPRRRPPVSSLDAEPGLAHIRRVFRSDGKLTISLNGRVWREHEGGRWDQATPARSTEELVSSLKDAWMENPMALSMTAQTLLMSRAREGGKSPVNPDPLARFLDPPGDGGKRLTRAVLRSVVVTEGILWGLLSEIPSGRTKLLRFRLSDEKFVCRPLDFSPEFEAAVVQAGGDMESSLAEMRLIPLPQGLALFKPGDPALWFIPHTLIDAP